MVDAAAKLRSAGQPGAAVPTWITGSWGLSCIQRDALQRLVDSYDAYLISQPSPAAKHIGILLRGAAGFFGRPVTQKNILRFTVVIKAITAVSLAGKNGDQFPDGRERRCLHVGQRLVDRHR